MFPKSWYFMICPFIYCILVWYHQSWPATCNICGFSTVHEFFLSWAADSSITSATEQFPTNSLSPFKRVTSQRSKANICQNLPKGHWRGSAYCGVQGGSHNNQTQNVSDLFKIQSFFKHTKSWHHEVCGRARFVFVQHPSPEQALPVESPPAKHRQRGALYSNTQSGLGLPPVPTGLSSCSFIFLINIALYWVGFGQRGPGHLEHLLCSLQDLDLPLISDISLWLYFRWDTWIGMFAQPERPGGEVHNMQNHWSEGFPGSTHFVWDFHVAIEQQVKETDSIDGLLRMPSFRR